jgi:RNA polymerase sigma factor (sigma-70 family)
MTDRGAEPSEVPKPPSRAVGADGEAPALRLVRAEELVGPASPSEPSVELSPALEDVVRRFGNFMRRTAHRHSLASSELDDVVQETRIRLWKALGTPDKIQQAPASYIYRTAMSAALDFLRRRRARREDSFDPQPGAPTLPFASPIEADTAVLESEVQAAVLRAVNLLVESRRAVVRMYLAGYERDEIADLLGWSEAKTRNLLYRGLADVRQSLSSWGFGPGAVT